MDFRSKIQFKPARILAGLSFGFAMAVTGQVSAALVNAGNGLINDTDLNITWTQDGNLLRTLADNHAGLVDQIIAANGGVIRYASDTITHTLTASDFNVGINDARVNWFGAQAWVGYLNNISYAGYSDWRLPATPAAAQFVGDNVAGSELGHLYYREVGGVSYYSLYNYHNDDINLFKHFYIDSYWSGDEVNGNSEFAWYFNTNFGHQGFNFKSDWGYAWAVRTGNVAAVPVPAAVYLFASALAGLIGVNRRKAY